jgi:hypothetical protein
MKSTFHFALAVALLAFLALRPSFAMAATPVSTAVYRAGDDAVQLTPVRHYRPYGAYHRPYYAYRPYVYRPYVRPYGRPYVYRPYVYRTYAYPSYYAPAYPYYYRPYPGYYGYYGRPRIYFGFNF